MAIGFARFEFVKRSAGKTSCAKSAYNGRDKIEFEGNKSLSPRVYDWTYKEKPSFHEVMLPKNVDKKFLSPQVLWNLVEKAETRYASVVASELVLALPDDDAISLEDKIHLTKSFIQDHFIRKGFAAQADIHPPEQRQLILEETGEEENNSHNWHAHVLISPRRFNEEGDGFEKNKPRDLTTSIRGGIVISGPNWGKLWTQHQNDYFESKGLNLRVDPTGIVAQMHLGPRRMMGKNSSLLLEQNNEIIEENRRVLKDPGNLLKKITELNSFFSPEDLEKHLQQFADPVESAAIKEKFWQSKDLIQLVDRESGSPLQLFSSVQVIEEERKILRLAEKAYARPAMSINESKMVEFFTNLSDEQKKAYIGIIQGQSLSCIEGHAGTGKSVLLAALKNCYESNGYKVRAFGPDNATAQVLKEKGLSNATNIHRFLFKKHYSAEGISTGKEVWIIDESSKVANRPLLELLKLADKFKAQVVLAGNSSQLPSVERGGMFQDFSNRFGYQFLGEIRRQSKEEQRVIAKRLAEGKMSEAIDMIASTGGFKWAPHKEGAMIAAFEQWVKDRGHFPYASSLLIAHSNKEVIQLNELAHFYRKSIGELGEKEFECDGPFGKFSVSSGDAIEFRKNDNALGVSNGLKGVLLKADENKFEVLVSQKGKEKRISFNPKEYSAFHLGYASTYYRSQGQTIDRAYLLHSSSMNRELMYVGLTRHVKSVTCFVSMEDASCLSRIKMQAMRSCAKKTTLEYTTQAEMEHESAKKAEYEKVRFLMNSDSSIDRFKGSGLKSWNFVRGKVSEFIEKVQDRSADPDFYDLKLPYKVEGKGRVVEVQPQAVVQEGTHFVETLVELKSGQLEQKAQQKVDTDKPQISLSKNDGELIRRYFERIEESRSLHIVVQSEATNRGCEESLVPSYEDWMKSCGNRNEAAAELYKGVSHKKLNSLLGKMSFEFLQEQSERHLSRTEQKEPLEDKLKSRIEPLLQTLFPEGPSGKDPKGFRFGSKGSLSVVCRGEKLGSFYDFEAGEGGNLLTLIQKRHNINPAEARDWAQRFLEEPVSKSPSSLFSISSFKESKPNDWVYIMPPKGAKVPDLSTLSKSMSERYQITYSHPYHNKNGQVVFYTLRLQDKNDPKSKIVVPLSYGFNKHKPDRFIWSLKKPDFEGGKAPLYNCHLLQQLPQKPVLIVEGEKTADAGPNRFGNDYITISWMGGSGAAKRADWTQLAGRDVVIWPDNDAPGFKAADEIALCLKQVGVGSLRIVDKHVLAKEFPAKWDIADAHPTGKTEQSLKDYLNRAEQKAVPIERLDILRKSMDLQNDVFYSLQRLNEILWRVDERMRPDLEKKFGSKTWEIEKAVLNEVSTILQKREALSKPNTLNQTKEKQNEVIFSAMLHRAKSGDWPVGSTDIVGSLAASNASMKTLYTMERQHELSRQQVVTRDF